MKIGRHKPATRIPGTQLYNFTVHKGITFMTQNSNDIDTANNTTLF